jgi:hypothetical protein
MPPAAKGARLTGAPHPSTNTPTGAEEWMAFFTDDEGRDLALHSVVR